MPVKHCPLPKTGLFILGLVLALSICAAAQVTTADVVGRVTDSSGAVLPGVTVVIENLGTGATRSVVSSDTGLRFQSTACRPIQRAVRITGIQDIHHSQPR